MGKKIGIDLGTTYSVVSYVDDMGQICNIESSEGDKTTPSVVFFDPDGQTVVVGSAAREAGAMNPECLVERVKNFMGDPDYRCYMNGQEYSAAAVSALILKKLVGDAEQALGGEEIEGAVITCPAYFGDAAREATRKAGESVVLQNGEHLKVLKVMDEPTAAAIAYGKAHSEDMHKTVLIYDLGGGTFDCTVMRFDFEGDNRKYQVVTTGGNHQLGGKDWDKALADYVRSEFCNATGADISEMEEDAESKAWFSENIEKAKKQLTSKDSTKLTPSFGGQKAQVEITIDKFNELTENLFSETISLIDQMCEKKGIDLATEIDEIILVGGSTRMRQVETGLADHYGKPLVKFDPDKAVSNGAALVASGINVDANFGEGEDGAPAPVDGTDGGATLGGASITFDDQLTGQSNEVVELCTKSYCMRYNKGGAEAYKNLVVKDTPKPAFGSTATLFGDAGLTLTGNPAPVSSIPLYIMENESLNEDVTKEECAELYEEMPIELDPPVPGNEPVEVELNVDGNGQLTLTLVILSSGKRYALHPVRRGGEDNTLGNIGGFTLG